MRAEGRQLGCTETPAGVEPPQQRPLSYIYKCCTYQLYYASSQIRCEILSVCYFLVFPQVLNFALLQPPYNP